MSDLSRGLIILLSFFTDLTHFPQKTIGFVWHGLAANPKAVSIRRGGLSV
jgi:hypothetical protein